MRSIVEQLDVHIRHPGLLSHVLSQGRSVTDVRRFDQDAEGRGRDSQGWGNGLDYCSKAPTKFSTGVVQRRRSFRLLEPVLEGSKLGSSATAT